MPKVSVIVPVYNSEKYLNKCLDSLVNQTMKDIEIIIVNDGSSDGSQRIIDDYANMYPERIKKFFKENGGQASARNFGIRVATGEFIGFVDSDDYIEIDTYEKVYGFAIQNGLDIVSFDFWEENETEKWKSSYYRFKDYSDNVKYVLNETSSVNKIIKKELIDKNNIQFLENYIYEDLELIPRLILCTDKVGFLDECLYHYVIHEKSTMRQNEYNPKLDSIFFVMEQLKKNFENTEYAEELEFIFIEHLLHGAVLRYLEYPEGDTDIRKISDIMKENFKKWRKNKYYRKQSIKYRIICNLAYYKKIRLLKIILKK